MKALLVLAALFLVACEDRKDYRILWTSEGCAYVTNVARAGASPRRVERIPSEDKETCPSNAKVEQP